MKYSITRFLMVCVAALLLFSNVAQAQAGKPVPYQEGLHYFLIEGAPAVSGDTMKLEEAFSYLCTHCFTFEPYVAKLEAAQTRTCTVPENSGRIWPRILGALCTWLRDR